MRTKRKIQELKYDLRKKREIILRTQQTQNQILDILFSPLDCNEKNNRIGWLLINNKITETEKSYED